MPGIRLNRVHIGSISSVPPSEDPFYDWMGLPFFYLPATGVVLQADQQVTLYGDELINVPIDNDLQIVYTCDIGTQSGKNLVLNPTAAQIGDHELTITLKNGNRLITSQTINLAVESLAARNVSVLMIGDSTLDSDIETIAPAFESRLTGSTLTYIGTKGSTRKHEGIAGWTYAAFATNVASPFVKAGVIDIPAYFTDNLLSDPDIVYFRLGVNEALSICQSTYTDAKKDTILGYIDSLVNAFVAYKSSIRILIAVPTECENTGFGWNTNYDPLTHNQDLYIEAINRLRAAIVSRYANASYSQFVDVCYDTIHLDRDTGYLKVDGVHSNGVHLATLGNQQMGAGLAPYFNKVFSELNFNNQDLSVTWIDDFARLTWIDGETYQTEIWESKNGGVYSLVATTAVGAGSYDNYTQQNATMTFKIRHLKDGVYSEYSEIVSINTPLVFKTNQSTLVPLVLNSITVVTGKAIRVNWGDDTFVDLAVGVNSNVTKNYSTTGQFFVQFTGDTKNGLSYIRIFAQSSVYGDLSKWNAPTSITSWYMYQTGISGDLSSIILPSICTSCWLHTTNITGVPRITSGSGGMNYDVKQCKISTENLTSFKAGMTIFNFRTQLSFSTAEVDKMLLNLANYYQTTAPTASCTFALEGTGHGIPTGGNSNVDLVRLKGYYTAAGFTATVTVRTV